MSCVEDWIVATAIVSGNVKKKAETIIYHELNDGSGNE